MGYTGRWFLDGALSISTLPDNSSIVTGYFSGDAAFGNTTLASNWATNRWDIFIAKITADGSFDGTSVPDDPGLTINTQADTTFGGTVSNLATLTTDAVARLLQRPTSPPRVTRPTTTVCAQHQPDTHGWQRQLYWRH